MSSPTIVHPATPAVWDNAPVLGNASWYIASGLAVLPVAHRDKRPRSGFRWGSVSKPQDVESIEALFTETPPMGVGIICGEPSGGLVVLDLDGKLLLENVLDACPALRDTWIVRTGRTQPGAGFHIFVRASGPTPTITGGAFHDDLGLDIKATGSYVVAAPSLHSSGRVYEWQQGIPEQIVDVGSTQSFLIALMRGLGITLSNDAILEQLDRAFASGHRTVAEPIEGRIPESIRNKTLTSLAGSMRRRGASVKAILTALKVENASRCDPPLEVSEVRRIAASIGRYAPSGDLPTLDPYRGLGVGQGSLPMLSLAELRERHSGDVDWIVDGYLARGELIFLAGAGESLKSWIAAHLAAAIVGDFRWLGCFEVHAERVLFVEQERAGNLVYQLNRIGIAERVDLDRDGLRIIPPVPMPLSDPQAQMALEEAIESFRPDVVIINALRDVLGRANENSPSDMAEILTPLGRMSERNSCLTLVLDHFNKLGLTGATRGNAAHAGTAHKHAAADAILIAERQRDEMGKGNGPATVSVTKRRSGEPGSPFTVSVTDTADGGVLVRAEKGAIRMSPTAREVYEMLKEAPSEIAPMVERVGKSKKSIDQAVSELRKIGLVDGAGDVGKAFTYWRTDQPPTPNPPMGLRVGQDDATETTATRGGQPIRDAQQLALTIVKDAD